MQAPVPTCPDFKSLLIFYTDATEEHAAGFNITQIKDGLERSIMYGLRNFSDMENKYISTEQEALSVIITAGKCQPYLLGSHFIIAADHEELWWLIQWKNPTGLLARWTLNLKSHGFGVKYRPGKKHGNADALPRWIYTRTENLMPQENSW